MERQSYSRVYFREAVELKENSQAWTVRPWDFVFVSRNVAHQVPSSASGYDAEKQRIIEMYDIHSHHEFGHACENITAYDFSKLPPHEQDAVALHSAAKKLGSVLGSKIELSAKFIDHSMKSVKSTLLWGLIGSSLILGVSVNLKDDSVTIHCPVDDAKELNEQVRQCRDKYLQALDKNEVKYNSIKWVIGPPRP